MILRRAMALFLPAMAALAQNGSQFNDWKASGETWKPRVGCAHLRSLTGYDFTIAAADVVAAGPDAPEYCRVTGQILPEILFEVSLPASWNGRFYMFGNGGYAGESLDAARCELRSA